MTVPKRQIKAVLFDYGLVLTGPPDQAADRVMHDLIGAEEEDFRAAYWRHRDAYDRGILGGAAYWRQVAQDTGKMLNEDELRTLIAADNQLWTQPNSGMIEWVKRLHGAGMKTGILSNLGDEMEAGITARFEWLKDFTHRTFSHRLGIAKPDMAIYRYAAEGLSTPAEKILFIDDKAENVAGARLAGMVAVRYGEHHEFVDEMERMGLGWLLAV